MPHRNRVVIDKVRKDGLVFASDYTDCDHGMDGFRKVLFRLQAGAPRLQIGAAYSLEYESEDLQKPFVQKSRSGKTTTYYTQMFYHKVRDLTLVAAHPEADLLLDL